MTLDTTTISELKSTLEQTKTDLESELAKFATKSGEGEYETRFPEDLGSERSENANEVEEYTDKLGVEKSLETQLRDVLDALERVEAGTYGQDVETGKDIPVERLRAYPAAKKAI